LKLDVAFVRHEDSVFPSEVETGFSIAGTTQVVDNYMIDEATNKAKVHELEVNWRGGKGLINQKLVTLEFVDPDTDIRSEIVVDLIGNRLYVPESVADLFPESDKKYEDNGYGASVAAGLNGGDPMDSFQPFEQAKTVNKWGSTIKDKGRKRSLTTYPRGMSMQEIEQEYDLRRERTLSNA
jgi:hypothetical protein